MFILRFSSQITHFPLRLSSSVFIFPFLLFPPPLLLEEWGRGEGRRGWESCLKKIVGYKIVYVERSCLIFFFESSGGIASFSDSKEGRWLSRLSRLSAFSLEPCCKELCLLQSKVEEKYPPLFASLRIGGCGFFPRLQGFWGENVRRFNPRQRFFVFFFFM